MGKLMLLESNTCDNCTRCAGCERRVCFNEEPSPGEVDGLCVDCWLAGDDAPMETPC